MSEPTDKPALDDLSGFTVEGAPGDFIYHEGGPSPEMYVVIEGDIEVLDSSTGHEHRLARLTSGDFFGEEFFLADSARATAARGATEFKLLRIDSTVFDQMIHEIPAIATHIIRGLSFRLKESREREIEALRSREKSSEVDTVRQPAEARSTGVPGAYLVHPATGAEFPLSSEGITRVGRPDPVMGFVPDVDLENWDATRSLSRRHARIIAAADGYYLVPEPAAPNGTFLDGERVQDDDRVKLDDGCEVRFGLVETVFRIQEP